VSMLFSIDTSKKANKHLTHHLLWCAKSQGLEAAGLTASVRNDVEVRSNQVKKGVYYTLLFLFIYYINSKLV